MRNLLRSLIAAAAVLLLPGAHGANTDISTSPLEIGSPGVVKPNVMLLFDDSGSMGWDYMPDWLSGMFATWCVEKPYSGNASSSQTNPCTPPSGMTTIGLQGNPPYYAYQFNGIFYNPNQYYQTPVDATGLQWPTTGATYPSYTSANSSGWTKVPVDGYASSLSYVNLTNAFIEAVWCSGGNGGNGNGYGGGNGGISYPTPSYTSSTLPSTCRRNGTANTGNPFAYNFGTTGSLPNAYPDDTATISGTTVTITKGTYVNPSTLGSNPFYYDIQAVEYCMADPDPNNSGQYLSTSSLVNCQIGKSGAYTFAAPVRFCVLESDQMSTAAVSGTTTFTTGGALSPRCQKKYNLALGYTLPRYGKFYRNDIVPGTATYTRASTRTDCSPVTSTTPPTASCSYAQEMTNFANWFAYYHTRIQMAKTAVGLAFNSLTSSYRVGMLTINAYGNGSTVDTTKFVPIGTFNATQKSTFYTTFYKLTAGNSTPLREALSRVGWYYAGKTTGLSAGMIQSGTTTAYQDPVQYSCQQNFTIMTTDGYWNGNPGQDLAGNKIEDPLSTYPKGQQDNDLTNPYIYRSPTASLGNWVYGPGGYYDGNLADTTSSSGSGGGKGNQGYGGGGSTTYTSTGTLADTAMYYYKTDLRPAGSVNYNTKVDVSTDDYTTSGLQNAQVPTASGIDMNPKQHMVTYTIGLGVDGYLTYDAGGTYNSVDFRHIVNGDSNCTWAPNLTCNWPQVPGGSGMGDDPSKDDDLWHAAVNGHGSYLSAKNPSAFYIGLANDLALITEQTGAAAAAATSTPNITATNNAIFNTTFQTATWDGQLQAQTINVSTGVVSSTYTWINPTTGVSGAQGLLDTLAAPATDSRTIYTESGGALVPFQYTSLDATAQSWFTNLCNSNAWTQCITLSGTDLSIVNSGPNLVGFLRGQGQYSDGTHWRSRDHILGDLVDSRPTVVAAPTHNYADAAVAPANQSYAAWVASPTVANRTATVFVGGNDGMLHAFNAATGYETWAYMPRMLLSHLYLLGDLSYATQHQFYVDGSPEVADVMDSQGYWHTILVAGLNDGGMGYFALDVTNPSAPSFLWEFCNDPGLCTNADANLGLSFGNPVVTKRAVDGKWVVLVSSGYNNNATNSASKTGNGVGAMFEIDPFTGAELAAISTGVGTTATPSGLGRLTAIVNNPNTDNTAKTVYGGDLLGNLWRFDLTKATPTASLMATLRDANNVPQSITTRPEVGQVNSSTVVYVGTGRMLGASDLTNPPPGNWSYLGSLYALVDNGTNLGNPRIQATIVKQTLSGTTVLSITNNAVSIPANIGWYVDFLTTGERVNVDPQLALGTLVVTTNIPISSPCVAGGSSYLYQFGYANGSGVGTTTVATETTTALTVGNVIVQLPSGAVKIISTLSNGKQVTTGLNTAATSSTLRHVNWRVVPQ